MRKKIVLFGKKVTVPPWIPVPQWAEQFLQFGIIGTFNTFFDLAILMTLSSLTGIKAGVGAAELQAISFSIVSFISFLANKKWTFREKSKDLGETTLKYFQFIVITIGGLLIKAGLVYVVTTFIPPLAIPLINFQFSKTLWLAFASLGATVVSLVWNFLGYKFIVFKK